MHDSPQMFCGSIQPHDMHYHTVNLQRVCSGTSACGQVTHDSHAYWSTEVKQCEGTCTCKPGIDGKTHSPGYHK